MPVRPRGAGCGYASRVRIAPAFSIVALLVVTHCSKERQDKEAPASSASGPHASEPEAAPAAGSGKSAAGKEEVRSVYPIDAGPPDPLAHKLCSALQDLPEQRRATCCDQGIGVVVTSECERMLTAAVSSKAASLDGSEVDRCVSAMQKAYEGCDWIGPFPPDTPDECQSLIHGSLLAGAACRSSLECVKGLRCQGVGPTRGGVCGPAREDGQACGTAVDTLAVYTKEQAQLESAHPECTGHCDRLRCAPLVPLGGSCRTGGQCADAGCAAGKCAPHVLGKPGGACPTGECSEGARCISGKCVVRQLEGGACKTDLECLGGCIKSDGGAGVCGKRCSAR
jgi:hypothetical protein